jgi:hypothetical protein
MAEAPKVLGVREKAADLRDGRRGARTDEYELVLTRTSGSLIVVPLTRDDLFKLAGESISALHRLDKVSP